MREKMRAWLEERLLGEWSSLRGRGGPGDEEGAIEGRILWERELGRGGWIGQCWPDGLSLEDQVIWAEEYARARAPGRVGHIGENLVGPTICAFGSAEQKARFLPPIRRGDELWCQGYSEPNAGSDLANVQTRADKRGDAWVVTGQKVWTSLAHRADWCFALCRTDPAAPRHRGLSYLLIPMKQPGVTVRPIKQITGTCEFNEVFFDEARTEHVLGEVGGGWKVAMATLGFERGLSTLVQLLGFTNELAAVIDAARASGAAKDPLARQRLARAWMGLQVIREHARRTLGAGADLAREAMILKLAWSHWHRDLGELAMDVLGPAAEVTEGALQRLFLFTRADTIYAGTSEIQKNLIAERALGLPKEPT